jgi:hypothetical protein
MGLNYVLLCVIAEEEKQKPKRKREKQLNILKPSVKKMKGQAANNKGNYTSEATNNVSKVKSNNVPENKPDETSFSGSLYTQELSSKENENLNEKTSTDARSKAMQFESMNEISKNDTLRQKQDASSLKKPENVSLPKCKQLNTNSKIHGTTDKMETLPDDESETQFTVTSENDEDVINCSQDFFSSQFRPSEQNMSQKKKVDTCSVSTDAHALQKSSISGQATGRNKNTPCKRNETGKIIADSSTAALNETNETEQIKMTNSLLIIMEKDTGNELESGGALIDNNTSVAEANTSVQSVLQPDVSNPSTSIALSGSHLNWSDEVPLVPHSQYKTLCTKADQVHYQNFDAVVPELNVEDFDNNSYESLDFEPEE